MHETIVPPSFLRNCFLLAESDYSVKIVGMEFASPSLRLLAFATALALASATSTSPTPPPACVVSAGAHSFDLAELGGGGGGGSAGGAPPLRHVSDSLGRTYFFAACGDVEPLPAACAGAAPGSAALQETADACYGLGASTTRTVAATATGVALSFSGGDGGRSIVVAVECADVERPQVMRWSSGAAPGSYTALVRARAGCALECARDAATGAVCGGRKTTASDRNPLSNLHGAAILIVLALAFSLTLLLRSRARWALPQISIALVLLISSIVLAEFFSAGGADIMTLGPLRHPPVPLRSRTRPAPADSAENGDWVWTAVYRGNAMRPPHLAVEWTSQVGQDVTIAEIFEEKRGGFFLDLAANDAAVLSNTLMLEQSFGWRGICVEANPE